MPASILTTIVGNVSHLGLEILIFITTEILARLIFVRRSGNRSLDGHTAKLLLTQGTILVVISALLAAYHHRPYILLLLLLGIAIRLVHIGAVYAFPIARNENNAMSSPLQHISVLEDEPFQFPFEQPGLPPVRRPMQQQPLSLSKPSDREHTPPPGVSNGSTYTARTTLLRSRSNTQHTSHPEGRTYYHTDQPTVGRRTVADAPGGFGSVSNTSPQHKVIPSLHRSPITSIYRPLLHAQLPTASRFQESLFRHAPSLNPFSSFFDARKPSTTPPGILNAGNTCFVNSVLQCLVWTPGFVEVIPVRVTGSEISTADMFLHNLSDVLKKCCALPDGEAYFSPVDASEFLDSLSQNASHLVVARGTGRHQSQQDVAEFLLWLLDCLHDLLRQQDSSDIKPLSPEELAISSQKRQAYLLELEKANSSDIPSFRKILTSLSTLDYQLNRTRNSSRINELFMGQLVEARECQQCRKMSVNLEYFTVLPLPLPLTLSGSLQRYTLKNCFTHFGEVEDLIKTNMIRCPCTVQHQMEEGGSASLTPGKRLALLSRPPSRLVIQLTRFSYDSVRRMAIKNTIPIDLPTSFDLYPYTMEAKLMEATPEGEPKNMLYLLHAFCVHTGAQTTTHGHYMAYCKAANGNWYCFNDRNVTYIADISKTLGSAFVLQNAYLLLYTSQSAGVES